MGPCFKPVFLFNLLESTLENRRQKDPIYLRKGVSFFSLMFLLK